MVDPKALQEGLPYFTVTYPDPSLTKPIIASYEYAGQEQFNDGESAYMFRYMPVYTSSESDPLEDGYVAYSETQLDDLHSVEDLISELSLVKTKLAERTDSQCP